MPPTTTVDMPRPTPSRPRAPLLWVGVVAAAILVLPLIGFLLLWLFPWFFPGCGHDRADLEYFAALRGDETGMTREQQIAHMDQAILLAPKRAFLYETRAGYWVDLRRFDRARQDFDRAIELLDRPYARFRRALASCQAGEIERSLGDFDTAIARQPSNGQFYRGRSLARSAVHDSMGRSPTPSGWWRWNPSVQNPGTRGAWPACGSAGTARRSRISIAPPPSGPSWST